VSDLASQYVSIDNSAMTSILNAAASVVAPYSSSSMVVTVSEITIDSSGNAKIAWSDSLNGTARTVGSSITLPTSFSSTKSVSLIMGEVTYPYTPSMGYVVTGTISLYQNVYFYPRLSSAVSRVNS
jgi:Flp pilus assembly protein TadG